MAKNEKENGQERKKGEMGPQPHMGQMWGSEGLRRDCPGPTWGTMELQNNYVIITA